MKPLVYLAGPIKVPDPLTNAHAALTLSWRLAKECDIDLFVPHLNVFEEIMNHRSWEEWLEYDLNIVSRCDAIFRMYGESRGADREVAFANANDIPVFYLEMSLKEWRSKF